MGTITLVNKKTGKKIVLRRKPTRIDGPRKARAKYASIKRNVA